MNSKIITITIISVLLLSVFSACAGTTFAKVTETVPGGNIQYLTRANTTVNIPSTVNFKVGAYQVPRLTIQATFTEESTYSSGHSSMMISIDMGGAFVTTGIITTNAEAANYLRTAFRNTPVYKPGPPILDNVVVVSDDVLKVDRHGNSITVNFSPSSPIVLYMSTPTYPTVTAKFPLQIPAFQLQFDKYGGSAHSEFTTSTLVPYSGFITETKMMGFSSNAEFTCPSWNVYGAAGTSSFITMHGVQYWIPPV
jgi:hypothetical protein